MSDILERGSHPQTERRKPAHINANPRMAFGPFFGPGTSKEVNITQCKRQALTDLGHHLSDGFLRRRACRLTREGLDIN